MWTAVHGPDSYLTYFMPKSKSQVQKMSHLVKIFKCLLKLTELVMLLIITWLFFPRVKTFFICPITGSIEVIEAETQ